jgi:hypothetical protein
VSRLYKGFLVQGLRSTKEIGIKKLDSCGLGFVGFRKKEFGFGRSSGSGLGA